MGRVHFGEGRSISCSPASCRRRRSGGSWTRCWCRSSTTAPRRPPRSRRAIRRRPARRCAARSPPACWASAGYHGGDALACRQLLDDGLALARTGRSLAAAAAELVDRLVAADEIPPPGFGHRYHTIDPRATRLLQIAHELEVDHEYTQLIRAPSSMRSRGTSRSPTARCRSTSTARLRPSAATSACRPRSPTLCCSSRACQAWPPTRSRNAEPRAAIRTMICHGMWNTGRRRERLPDRRNDTSMGQ